MASRATDAMGLIDSMDAYAIKFPVSFLFLAQDLGIIESVAMVVTAGAVAYPISQVISNADEDATPRTVTISTTDTCTRRPERQERKGDVGLATSS